MIKNVYEKWNEVIAEYHNSNSNFICEYFMSNKCMSRIYFGVMDNKKTTYLEFDNNVLNNYSAPMVKGLSIYIKKESFIDVKKIYLCIENNLNNEDIFIAFISSLCDLLSNTTTYIGAIQAFEDTIKYYKDYFSNLVYQLSDLEEQGLCAELLQLKKYILLYGQESILSWQGPSKNKRDFVFLDKSIEIKSTLTQINPSILISSENQLDNTYPENIRLYLKVFIFEKLNIGFNLNSCIKEVSDLLTNAYYNKLFIVNILKFKIDINNYISKNNYSIQEERLYLITKEFPKITKKTITQEIYDVKYRINLSLLDEYEVEENECE